MYDSDKTIALQSTYLHKRLRKARLSVSILEVDHLLLVMSTFHSELLSGVRSSEDALELCAYTDSVMEQWDETFNDYHFETDYQDQMFDRLLDLQHSAHQLYAVARLIEADLPATWDLLILRLLQWDHFDTIEIACALLKSSDLAGTMSLTSVSRIDELVSEVCILTGPHGAVLNELRTKLGLLVFHGRQEVSYFCRPSLNE